MMLKLTLKLNKEWISAVGLEPAKSRSTASTLLLPRFRSIWY